MAEPPPPDPMDEQTYKAEIRDAPCPVVGIGASAGGLDALQRFFSAVSPQAGLAYVVVQHLDPDHSSRLAQILARATKLPVRQIDNEMPIEPDRVYVIPPGTLLAIAGNALLLSPGKGPGGVRGSIDVFLTSLAREQGQASACVILSGTGSDGTIGLRAIKESGGLTLAQADAEYDGMMRSAVTTGLVDFVLRPEEMPARIEAFFDGGLHASDPPIAPPSVAGDGMRQIFAMLRARTGHDFTDYKDSTIVRRVQRRMHMLQLSDRNAFVERLRQSPREVDLLLQDLLIGVTHFFRDPAAFDALAREVIPHLFENKTPDDTIRVWVPGCSTGEEAYSIAMLLRDAAPRLDAPRMQIFASDIDVPALELARIGRYPETIARDVPPERLERYFTREDGTYRVSGELREICLFSTHNLLRDAPFSKLDLLSCRNLLIYFNNDLQNRVIPLFHYALKPDGYLFLGPSENVTRHTRLFATVDKTYRLFCRRGALERRMPEFPLTSPDATLRRRLPATGRPASEPSVQAMAERALLERYAPAYVVINRDADVLLSSSGTGKYLELPAGVPDHNLLNLARAGLRLDLRAALHNAIQGGARMVQTNVTLMTEDGRQDVALSVQPLRHIGTPDQLYMVVFQEVGGVRPVPEPHTIEHGEDDIGTDPAAATIRSLEIELRIARERLQTTTEELESSTEELKSSNEELSSMNEELQSANEELETSKEELQSINEELQTVNAELSNRVEELSRSNSDMANLLASTQIATLFLDRDLTVKSFTPAAKDLFRLVESDTGRPITHVRALFDLDTLQEDAERVLRTLGFVERQIRLLEGDTRYVMRIMPYRTVDNVISGVVLTFTDVTRITEAEARIQALTTDLRHRIGNLETLLDLLPVGVLIADGNEGPRILVNQCGSALLGGHPRHDGLRSIAGPFTVAMAEGPDRRPLEETARQGSAVSIPEALLRRPDGTTRHVMVLTAPLRTESGTVRGGIAALVDISEMKAAEGRQTLLLHELQHRVKNILATVAALASRMARTRIPPEAFHPAFLERIGAMARTHDILSREAWAGAGLRAIAAVALEPYRAPGRPGPVVTGPDIMLRPNAATTLALVLHELATNAAKYGALASPEGQVEVAWVREEHESGGRIALAWTERGGPPAVAGGEGFGLDFVRRSVEYELQGTARLEFTPTGLRCAINIPLAGNAAGPTELGPP